MINWIILCDSIRKPRPIQVNETYSTNKFEQQGSETNKVNRSLLNTATDLFHNRTI